MNTKRSLFERARLPVAAFAAIVGLGACHQEQPKPQRPPPQVSVITIQPQTIPQVFTFVAQTESSRQVDIVARVSGYLDKIAYQEGGLVKAGQVLFQLDPKPFQAELDTARGELKAQQARLSTATANLKRVKPLAAQNALSQADLDRAQGEYDGTSAAVDSAQAKVKTAELNLGYTTIQSPVTGVTSRSLQREGAYINATGADAKADRTFRRWIRPGPTSACRRTSWRNTRDRVAKKEVLPPKDEQFEIELVLSDGAIYPYAGKINFANPAPSARTPVRSWCAR